MTLTTELLHLHININNNIKNKQQSIQRHRECYYAVLAPLARETEPPTKNTYMSKGFFF